MTDNNYLNRFELATSNAVAYMQRYGIQEYNVSTRLLRGMDISLLAPTITDKAIEILTLPKKIICDCPEPVHGTSDILRFIPEPQRLQKNYFRRVKAGERVSEVWKQVYFKLMDIASKGRIFCHPDIKDTLMATLGPDIIQECLESVIKEFEH